MKKIFILPILIMPIMAYATDPVGPAHVNSGAVIATASAPYATAGAESGDTTNVVSASYVKGAYNDAIAAVNRVGSELNNVSGHVNDIDYNLNDFMQYVNGDIADEIAGKQDKLAIRDANSYFETPYVADEAYINGKHDEMSNHGSITDFDSYGDFADNLFGNYGGELDESLITAAGALSGVKQLGEYTDAKLNNKSDKFYAVYRGDDIASDVFDKTYFMNNLNSANMIQAGGDADKMLITAAATAAGIRSQRVTAVTTWGSNATTKLSLTTAQQ